jgi:hypothetical protein
MLRRPRARSARCPSSWRSTRPSGQQRQTRQQRQQQSYRAQQVSNTGHWLSPMSPCRTRWSSSRADLGRSLHPSHFTAAVVSKNRIIAWPSLILALYTYVNAKPLRTTEGGIGGGGLQGLGYVLVRSLVLQSTLGSGFVADRLVLSVSRSSRFSPYTSRPSSCFPRTPSFPRTRVRCPDRQRDELTA